MGKDKTSFQTIEVIDNLKEIGTDSDFFDPNLVVGFLGDQNYETYMEAYPISEVHIYTNSTNKIIFVEESALVTRMKEMEALGWVFLQYHTTRYKRAAIHSFPESPALIADHRRVIIPQENFLSSYGNSLLDFNLIVAYTESSFFTFSNLKGNTGSWIVSDCFGEVDLISKLQDMGDGVLNIHEPLSILYKKHEGDIEVKQYKDLHKKHSGLKNFSKQNLV